MRLRKYVACIAACLLFFGTVLPAFAQKQESGEDVTGRMKSPVSAEDLYDSETDVYDILLHFSSGEAGEMTRKEQAQVRQKNAVSILEEGMESGDVSNYESFYISNGIHAVIKSKEVVEKLLSLEELDYAAANEKIHLVEPIRKKDRSYLYVPDEREIEWGVHMVHAEKVWDDFGIDGTGVTVGIIDTGVNYKLDAIKRGYKGYDPQTDTFDPSYYKDFIDGLEEPAASHVNDHGTHVAGTICGVEPEGHNKIGVAPGVKYISARVLDDTGSDTAMILRAAQWMLEQRPDIINNSWGGASDADPWFSDAVDAWREAGIVPVFAAGNQLSGEPIPGPGSIANPGNLLQVFSVGAVDREKQLGSFSKKGPSAFDKTGEVIKPDVAAPGVQVRSVDGLGNYVSWNGTSMAAPHVTGTLALIKQAAPELSVEQMEEAVRSSAEPLTDKVYDRAPNMAYGYGLVNAYDAVGTALGRESGEIYGTVYKDGADTQEAGLTVDDVRQVYAGRDYKVIARATDDVSVRQVQLMYWINGTEMPSVSMKLAKGDVKNGVYEAVISAGELNSLSDSEAGRLEIRVIATDFSGSETAVDKEAEIVPGAAVPVTLDFEAETPGLVIDGRWIRSDTVRPGEPDMPDGGRAYIGIDAGTAAFKSRVDSYLYLPPVNLATSDGTKKPALVFDQYQGFTGISTAQVQVSSTGRDDDWHVLYDAVIRPDQEERQWRRDSFDLSGYRQQGGLLYIRFYFYGHDADEGCGWYLDNIHIQNGEQQPPDQVTGIHGTLDAKGFLLKFRSLEHTDMDHYDIYRKERSGGAFTLAAEVDAAQGRSLVQPDGEKTYYMTQWYDGTAEENGSYEYKVQAVDTFGNKGKFSDILQVDMQEYTYGLSYDFENSDGNFRAVSVEGEVNDWQWGKPQKPDDQEGGYLYNRAWDHLLTNSTSMWGLNLNGTYSANQNSALVMPSFVVENENTTLFFDSYNTVSSLDRTSFTCEIRVKDSNEWLTIATKEEIQDNRSLRTWRRFEKNLAGYVGKEVEVRFRAVSGGTFIGDSDLGWYVDNVLVGMPKVSFDRTVQGDEDGVFVPQSADTAMPAKEPEGIPLRAKVKVVETGRYTYADERDGSYRIPIVKNESSRPYTVEFSAYGYETRRETVDLNEEPKALRKVVLSPAEKYTLSGKVTDESGSPLADVNVKVVSDEHIPLYQTDGDGMFTIDEVYGGEVVLRFYMRGRIPVEKTVDLSDNMTVEPTVLYPVPADEESVQDHGSTPADNGEGYQTIHFRGSMKGAAVRFQSPKQGGRLTGADIFFVNNSYYMGSHAKVGVLSYNEHGRLTEVVPFADVSDLRANEWNYISFEEYNIKTDRPVYVAVIYEKGLENSAGVFYDVNASDEAKKYSFIYDGSFIPVERVGQAGAYGIKTHWSAPVNAPENEPSPLDSGGTNTDMLPVQPLSEDDFVIDENGVITAYKGRQTNVKIPERIRGVEVTGIGAGAFDKTGRPAQEKLVRIEIPEGVTFIGEGAFKNNNLTKIILPDSLREIRKDAFKYQWKDGFDDRSLKVHIPDQVTRIEEGAFESSGSPFVAEGMKSVAAIERNAFAGIKDVTLYAPALTSVAEGAFGAAGSEELPYARIFTDTGLESSDGEYLVNPAVVRMDLIDAKDDELIYRRALRFGPDNPPSQNRNIAAGRFYKVGDKALVEPPVFKNDGITYASTDEPAELTLEKENQLSFYYYSTVPLLRAPVLDTDDKLMGFTLPKAKVVITDGSNEYEVQANEDGYFETAIRPGAGEYRFLINDKYEHSEKVMEKPEGGYIAENGKILRYIGDERKITIPSYIEGAGDIKAIGPFAFADKEISEVTLAQTVETVEAGAFMRSGLQTLSYDVKDVNLSKLRAVHDYAFKDNRLKKLEFGELFHVIRTKAFENNEIEELSLGRYIGHIGKAAFKNNRLKSLEIPGNIEDIGEEAFMNNEISALSFTAPPPKGSDAHYLSRIPALAFAYNRLAAVQWPDTVTEVADNALLGNPMYESGDAEEVTPPTESGGEEVTPPPGDAGEEVTPPGDAGMQPGPEDEHNDPAVDDDHFLNKNAVVLPEGKEIPELTEISSLSEQVSASKGAPDTGDDNDLYVYLTVLCAAGLVFLTKLKTIRKYEK